MRSTGSCQAHRAAGRQRSTRQATAAPSPRRPTSAIANAAYRKGAAILDTLRRARYRDTGRRGERRRHGKGTDRCSKVVLAGGAWSRLFCGNLGVELPQLKLHRLGDADRPDRRARRIAPQAPAISPSASGSTAATRSRGETPMSSRSCRTASGCFFDFLPALVTQWHELRLRVGTSFLEEWRIPRTWALDAETPFERVRTLDPEPSPHHSR